MIDSDPLFVDPDNNDFHLTWNSPCRDAGERALADQRPETAPLHATGQLGARAMRQAAKPAKTPSTIQGPGTATATPLPASIEASVLEA